MENPKTYPSQVNRQQTRLRELFKYPELHNDAIQLFLHQHAMLHSKAVTNQEPWSMEDEVFMGLDEAGVRRVAEGAEHSIAWLIWHVARCEDITMNLLVAVSPQVLLGGGWLEKLRINIRDTGNLMTPAEINSFSDGIDIGALREYHAAVGRRTQAIVKDLTHADIKRKPPADRIQRVWDEGAVLPGADSIVNYWSKRTTAGLLLMPASRHLILHFNEAMDLRKKLGK